MRQGHCYSAPQTAARASVNCQRAPILERCRCANTRAGGECESCSAKREGMLTRPAIAWAGERLAPPIVHQVLREPGASLDPQTHELMAARLGHDFSKVRVHTGERAALSARAVDARAYTVGHHVVFGAGEFAPGTTEGRRLLTHELAHVLHQRAAIPSGPIAIAPSTGPAEVEAERVAGGSVVQAPVGADVAATLQRQPKRPPPATAQPTGHCSGDQPDVIARAKANAAFWLRTAIQGLRRFEALPAHRSTAAVQAALQTDFHTTNPFHAQLVRGRLHIILDALSGAQAAPTDCAVAADPGCAGATVAYHQQGRLVWCPKFFASDTDEERRAQVTVHEHAHAHARRLPLGGGFDVFSKGEPRFVIDRAYRRERVYADLTPEEAMDNADSYAELVRDLGSGSTKREMAELPPDTWAGDCSPDQTEVVRRALSRVERWNVVALEILNDPSIKTAPSLDAELTAAITRHFGRRAPTRTDLATIYGLVAMQLIITFPVACDQGTPNCQGSASRMWSSGGAVPILCPSWFAEP